MAEPLFCCPISDLELHIHAIRSPSQVECWRFTCSMSNPDCNSILPTPVDLPLTTPITPHFLYAIIRDVPYAIQFEKWDEGKLQQQRYFIPHTGKENAYLEMEQRHVREDFVWDWQYLKFWCQHKSSMFVVKMLARYDAEAEAPRILKSKVVSAESSGGTLNGSDGGINLEG